MTMLAAGALYGAYGGGAFFVMAGMCFAGMVFALMLAGGRQ